MWSKKLLKRCYSVLRAIPNAMLDRPVWSFVWVTRQCKQACEHCYVYDNLKPHMSFQIYQQIIDKLKDLGITFVSIFGGEPTLHPQLIDMIKYAHSKKRVVFLNTDLTTVSTEQLTKIIVEAGIDIISFSLDRVEQSESNVRSISAVNNKLDMILALQAKGYCCALHCNVSWYKNNLKDAKGVVEYLHKKGTIGISVRPAVYPFPTSKISEKFKNLLLNREDFPYLEDLMAWVIEKKKEGYLILNPYSYLEGFPKFVLGNNRWDCNACRDILSIDTDGKVLQCSYFLHEVPEPLKDMSLYIGDLTLQGIKECRATALHNLRYCNAACYSPAYFCTAYYRNHLFELLKLYLKG